MKKFKDEQDKLARKKFEEDLGEKRLTESKKFFKALGELQHSKSKELFEIGKAAAIAESIIRKVSSAIIYIDSKESLTSEDTGLALVEFHNKKTGLIIFIKQDFLTPSNEKLIEENLYDYLALRRDNEIVEQYYDDTIDCLVVEIKKI